MKNNKRAILQLDIVSGDLINRWTNAGEAACCIGTSTYKILCAFKGMYLDRKKNKVRLAKTIVGGFRWQYAN